VRRRWVGRRSAGGGVESAPDQRVELARLDIRIRLADFLEGRPWSTNRTHLEGFSELSTDLFMVFERGDGRPESPYAQTIANGP
jgi:hypothetical protein